MKKFIVFGCLMFTSAHNRIGRRLLQPVQSHHCQGGSGVVRSVPAASSLHCSGETVV